MDEEREPIFARELLVRIPFETYQDPAQESRHRTLHSTATSGLFICEHLFWAVQHLAYYADNGGLAHYEHDFFETMQAIGLVGRSIVMGVNEEVDHLEHVAERSSEQGEGAK